tara:strand:- start:5306 stop:8053 length:2748 start_codon:yes stop_codon:yes gene_type:complete
MNDTIEIKNAHLNNLKKINLSLPKNKIIVFCGISGSGKSTLVFDTIFKEGQKRYIESLSSYARQYLDFYSENKVEQITGLSPAISIDQKTRTLNPRSTVGTLTEITDRLRVLFSKIGKPETRENKIPFKTPTDISNYLNSSNLTSIEIYYESKDGKIAKKLNGTTRLLSSSSLSSTKEKNNYYLLDQFKKSQNSNKRLISNIELLLNLRVTNILISAKNKDYLFSTSINSSKNHIDFKNLTPSHFSYNSPKGSCDMCRGLGEVSLIDPDKLFDNKEKKILNGASTYLSAKNRKILLLLLSSFLESEGIENKPFNNYSEDEINLILFGNKKTIEIDLNLNNSKYKTKRLYKGLTQHIKDFNLNKNSLKESSHLDNISEISLCPKCKGSRLANFTNEILIKTFSIGQLTSLPLNQLKEVILNIRKSLSGNDLLIGDKILNEVSQKLDFLNQIGLGYLTLNRSCKTLSGGESQRIRLSNQISSKLSGIIYVLDEPSIGLHPCDNDKLIDAIISLKKLNNTVLIVEHDEDTIKSADYIVEIGPGAGKSGGEVLFQGKLNEFKNSSISETAKFIYKSEKKYLITKVKSSKKRYLTIEGIKENNLKEINIKIPLGEITSITGPSGSGKSTLVHKVLSPAIKRRISNKSNQIIYKKNNYKNINGIENIDQVIELTQSPLGRSPKSNPCTYLGIFDYIRNIFSQTNEAKVRGLTPGHFSFNVSKGRCEACEGNGVIKTEMQFLPDVLTKCSICLGSRFKKEILDIKFKGLSIADILNLEVNEALNIFSNHKKVYKSLLTLNELGLGYLTLGQSSTTLSGGEAQRVKLAKEISKNQKGHCIYLLDEPTTGLHFKDINKLLLSFEKLRDNNATLVIIEHNKDIIINSDNVIDLGPLGGDEGGELVYEGDVNGLKQTKQSLTGLYL